MLQKLNIQNYAIIDATIPPSLPCRASGAGGLRWGKRFIRKPAACSLPLTAVVFGRNALRLFQPEDVEHRVVQHIAVHIRRRAHRCLTNSLGIVKVSEMKSNGARRDATNREDVNRRSPGARSSAAREWDRPTTSH